MNRVDHPPPEQRLLAALRHLGEGFGIVDAEERFTYVIPSAEEIFGVPPGTLVNRLLGDFLDEDQQTLVSAQTRQRRTGSKDSYELRIRRPDGEVRYLWVTVLPEVDTEGNYLGAAGFFRDITPRKETEASLQASESRFHILLEGAPTAIALTRGGHLCLVNSAWLRLFAFAQAPDGEEASLFERIHPEDLPTYLALCERTTKDPDSVTPLVLRAKRSDGGAFPARVTLRQLRLSEGAMLMTFFEDLESQDRQDPRQETLTRDLDDALQAVTRLNALLPICSYCKKIRDEHGRWSSLEAYFAERTGAVFSHGICPHCFHAHHPEIPST